jgi:probable rRNA maturation factor
MARMKKHPFIDTAIIIDFNSTVFLTSTEKCLINHWLHLSCDVIRYLLSKQIIPVKKVQRIHISLLVCGDKKIRVLNKDFRHKDKVTDVLSFPHHDRLRFSPSIEKDIMLGDIAICLPQTRRQSKKFKIDFMDEFIHLFFHGVIHLLGFDHEISLKEEKIMEAWEEVALKKFGDLKRKSS